MVFALVEQAFTRPARQVRAEARQLATVGGGPIDHRVVPDVSLDQFDAGIGERVFHVCERAALEVVEYHDAGG